MISGRETEFEFLCNTITINETSFFRNEPQMNAFQQKTCIGNYCRVRRPMAHGSSEYGARLALPVKNRNTLAMLYLEHIKPRYPDLHIEIIGTDINTAVMDMARTAEYSHYAIRSMRNYMLNKYFDNCNGLYRLRKEVKRARAVRITKI